MDRKQHLEAAKELFIEAGAIIQNDEADAQDAERAEKLFEEAKGHQHKAFQLAEIEKAAVAYADEAKAEKEQEIASSKFKSAGHFLVELYKHGDMEYRGRVHPYFLQSASRLNDADEKVDVDSQWLAKGSQQTAERKDLVESVGASGGFLVPVEYRPELLAVSYEVNPVRQRATIIPMRRRQINIPVLDQTQGSLGTTAMHGGIVATWTEEATAKSETQPAFRQVQLVAHKLTCYTETSDELLDDEAVGLMSFMNGPMGFSGAINWEEEYTFLQGTGAGQPLGVIGANATITVNRQVSGQVNVNDLFNMLQSHLLTPNSIWHINRSTMVQLLQLAGPAANPSYIWITNARDRVPTTLFGYDIHWTEKCPNIGDPGDVLLADWQYYLIGDRQATTIASSTHYRFQYDLTAWRAVHRVDGKPWLSEPITLADGVDQISPFVILGGGGS